MVDISVNESKFKFQYLPEYAKFLLENKLDEFVLVGIRFCRELNLPMMRPLAKIPETQLIELSRKSNMEILSCLADNNVSKCIEKNLTNFVNNNLLDAEGHRLLDKSEVIAEDLILGFHIRRKLFSFFMYSYTPNAVLHMLISAEVDTYTTEEHLLTTQSFIAAMKSS